jgi:hypothetical protein
MISETLPLACRLWSRIAALAYPVAGAPEIVDKSDPKASVPMEFYTDMTRIYVGLHQPQQVEAHWRTHLVPLYRRSLSAVYPGAGVVADDDLASNLWLDTLLFVLFHELYHPLVCPNSREDEKAISVALYRGLQSRLPGLQSLELLERTDQLKNLVWDLLVNTTFLARLAGIGHDPLDSRCRYIFAQEQRRIDAVPVASVPSAVVPAIYFLSAKNATTDLVICIMGALYTYLSAPAPDLVLGLLDAFRAEGQRLNCPRPPDELAMALLQELTAINRSSAEVQFLGSSDEGVLRLAQRAVLENLLRLFEHPHQRYQAVEVVGRFLAPLLRGADKQGSIDVQTCGHRGWGRPQQRGTPRDDSLGDTLQDLMETLPQEEADDLLRQAARPDGRGGGPDGSDTGDAWTPLTVAAADEFYKRHSTPLSFKSPESRAVRYDLGRQKQWRLKSVQTLTAAEAAQLDLDAVLTFQTATGLPLLMNLADGYYQLNEYVLRETPIRSYTMQAFGVEVPDNWVLLVDSSGSMGSNAYVDAGEKYDVLMRVCYGVARGLAAVAALLRKDLQWGVVNFSSVSTFSGMMDFDRAFGENFNPVKQALLVPQSGGTTLDVEVLKQVEAALRPGRTIYTLITDGKIDNGPDVVQYLAEWSRHARRVLVFIEIGVESQVGKDLRQLAQAQPAIACFQVDQVEEIEATLGSMLIRYTR